MRMHRHPAVLTFLLGLLVSCGSLRTTFGRSDANELADWMSGIFTSEAQAAQDPENFIPVQLAMERIWTERSDGTWLYVEQALTTALERPYRQRVYHVFADGDTVQSVVYELPGNPLEFAGAYREPAAFGALGPEELRLREGCAIELLRVGNAFVGSTEGSACKSELNGASYATSDVTITPNRLISWDRGYDSGGKQVWGATAGPYRFDRVASE